MWAVCFDCCTADWRGLWEKQNNVAGESLCRVNSWRKQISDSSGHSADQVIRLSRAERPCNVGVQRGQFVLTNGSTFPTPTHIPAMIATMPDLVWNRPKTDSFQPKMQQTQVRSLEAIYWTSVSSLWSHKSTLINLFTHAAVNTVCYVHSVDFPSKSQASHVQVKSHVLSQQVSSHFSLANNCRTFK